MRRKDDFKMDDCYIAFLDILGFKSLMDGTEKNNRFVYQIFKGLKSDITTYLKLREGEMEKLLRFTIMSDSIVIATKERSQGAMSALIGACLAVQLANFCRNGTLIRGAIAEGEIYLVDNIIFGKGLVEAYTLEKNSARYPRIIITEKLLKQSGAIGYHGVIKDIDNLYFIDYLHIVNHKQVEDVIEMNISSDIIVPIYVSICVVLRKIEEVLLVEKDESIKEKYIWLKGYIDKNVETIRKKDFMEIIDREKRKQLGS